MLGTIFGQTRWPMSLVTKLSEFGSVMSVANCMQSARRSSRACESEAASLREEELHCLENRDKAGRCDCRTSRLVVGRP